MKLVPSSSETDVCDNGVFQFQTGAVSHQGCVRKINEDRFFVQPRAGLWVVSDGMGGHAAGDFASQTIVDHLATTGVCGTLDDAERRVMERLRHANQAILDHADAQDLGSIGATVVVFSTHEDQYHCIWAGDSRAYHFRAGRAYQATVDHTEVQMLLDAGDITPEDAVNWPRRNVITRAVGVSDFLDCDLSSGDLKDGDLFLLCSDGLTEHLTLEDIERGLQNRDQTPQEICNDLLDLTLSRGAKDNVTIVVIKAQHAPPPLEIVDADLPNLRGA